MSKEIREYDERGNLIYHRYRNGFESWMEYNKNNLLIQFKDGDGFKTMREYDEDNNLIRFKNSYGIEEWWRCDRYGNRTGITRQEFKQIERTKLYFNNKKINRFEIMDI